MKISTEKVLLGILVIMPFTGFLGVPALPTWRILNILFVLLGLATFKISLEKKELPYNLMIFQGLFLLMVVFQYIGMGISYEYSSYDTTWALGIIFLFFFSWIAFVLLKRNFQRILNVVYYAALINLVYQLYQQVVFQLRLYRLATIFNELNITYGKVFFKITGGILGSPGLMAEAGHLALFLGPCLIWMVVADYYGIWVIERKKFLIILTSMVLTISSGSFLQIGFLLITYLLTIRRNISKKQITNLVIGLGGTVTIFMLYDKYRDAILFRFFSIFEQDSPRMMGAVVYWQAFQENFWFGLGPKCARFIGADPNFFITTVFADHGFIAGIFLLLAWFGPVTLAFIRSKRKLFIMPFVATTIHLFLAYGTFTWPFIWLNICMVIFALENRQNELVQTPKSEELPTSAVN